MVLGPPAQRPLARVRRKILWRIEHCLDLDPDKLLALQLGEQPVEHPGLGPAVDARIDRMPVTKSLRQRTRLAAMLGHKEDRVNHFEILLRDIAALTRQVLLDSSKLCSGDLQVLACYMHEVRDCGADGGKYA